MRLAETAVPVANILNPRGNLAKELETTARKASWLSLVCSYWLAYHQDDYDAARHDEPTYNLPPGMDEGGRFRKARKECGGWERMAPTKAEGARPAWSSRWCWSEVFDYWYSGGLDRGVEYLKSALPEDNVKAIEKEMLL